MLRRFLPGILFIVLLFALVASCTGDRRMQWYRGNMHTHSLWSDGDAAPEVAVDWYRSHGYHFLSLTEHDRLSRAERWFPIEEDSRLTAGRVEQLRERFGTDWVEVDESHGDPRMRLKTLAELRDRFEEAGQFRLIEGFEISDRAEGRPIHLNVLNPVKLIPTQGGETIVETLNNSVAAVNDQAQDTGANLLVFVCHPNYRWAISPEQLAAVEGTPLFEIYNGSTSCNNYGDEEHPGMDEAWDRANTRRLFQLDLPPLYGIANDDAHDYFDFTPQHSHPGRGWIMVRAAALETDAILDAIREGAFYATTGVELLDVERGRRSYTIHIAAEEGLTYTTQFVGTRLVEGATGEVGVVLYQTTENPAVYHYAGDELYVRARVASSRWHANAIAGEEAPEYAWTQPAVPRRR